MDPVCPIEADAAAEFLENWNGDMDKILGVRDFIRHRLLK